MKGVKHSNTPFLRNRIEGGKRFPHDLVLSFSVMTTNGLTESLHKINKKVINSKF